MKGKNTLLWISYVIAAWLCCSVAFASTSELSSTLKPNEQFLDWYKQKLKNLHNQFGNSNDKRYGIPVLFHKANVPNGIRFVRLTMNETYTRGYTLKFVLDKTNVKVVAFLVDTKGFIFNVADPDDANAINGYVKTISTRQELLQFSNNYDALEKISGTSRGQVGLGFRPLIDAVQSLYYYAIGTFPASSVARSFIIINQMITEAGRFRQIEVLMSQKIRHNQIAPAHASMISLEDNWEALSRAVQETGRQGTFTAVQLERYDGSQISVDNVGRLVGGLSLLMFHCDPSKASSTFWRFIRSVVPNLDGGVCEYPEPTMFLVGRNNLCVNLYQANYINGSRINSWRCIKAVQQKWTLKRDGTIRSKNMCLTTYGYIEGDYVMIYNCSAAVLDATRWEVKDDGTIINPRSGLVLSVTGAAQDTTLTVQKNSYAASQGWFATNDAQPFVAPVLGLKELCLQANEKDIQLETCAHSKSEQEWAFYGDGSIRPPANSRNCLTTDGTKGSVVQILSCDPASSGQRWLLKNDGSIWNLYYGLVLDVQEVSPNLQTIIVGPYNGGDNQLWTPLM